MTCNIPEGECTHLISICLSVNLTRHSSTPLIGLETARCTLNHVNQMGTSVSEYAFRFLLLTITVQLLLGIFILKTRHPSLGEM